VGHGATVEPLASTLVTVVATLVVALHLAAIVDVALMPAWAWRGAADASKRRWVIELALIPGWAVVYYRSGDRREVRAHLFRCGGVEPDWHARHAPEDPPRSLYQGAVATMKDRQLVREVLDPPPGTDLVPIKWHPGPPALPPAPAPSGTLAAPPAAPASRPRELVAAPANPGGRARSLPPGPPAPRELLPPIRWYAADHEPQRALRPPKPRLRLTA
jgi:hypothetical protein